MLRIVKVSFVVTIILFVEVSLRALVILFVKKPLLVFLHQYDYNYCEQNNDNSSLPAIGVRGNKDPGPETVA